MGAQVRGLRLGLGLSRTGGSLSAYIAYAMADDFDNSKYRQADTNAATSGTTKTAPSGLAGYTFTVTGACYELNSDGTIAGPFAANVPAITDAGFKARQALTNAVLQSQAFASGWSTPVGGAWSSDTTVAPDGTTTADTLTADTATSSHRSQQAYTLASASAFTFSIFAKAGTGRYLQIVDDHITGSGYINFDLVGGTVGSAAVGYTGYMVDCGSGWYRCIVTGTAAAVSGTAYLVIANSATAVRAVSFTGASESIHLWQAQSLIGNLPNGGPLIVTTTAAATRGEALLTHNIFADGSALTDQDMLIWAKGTPGSVGADQTILQIDDGTNSNRVAFAINPSALVVGVVISGGVALYNRTVAGAVAAATETTILMRRLSGAWQVAKYVSGVLTWGLSEVDALPAGITKARPGNALSGVPFRGTIDSAFIDYGTFATDADVIAAITGAP